MLVYFCFSETETNSQNNKGPRRGGPEGAGRITRPLSITGVPRITDCDRRSSSSSTVDYFQQAPLRRGFSVGISCVGEFLRTMEVRVRCALFPFLHVSFCTPPDLPPPNCASPFPAVANIQSRLHLQSCFNLDSIHVWLPFKPFVSWRG